MQLDSGRPSLASSSRPDTPRLRLSCDRADIGAAIENENACQNKVSQPQPRSYGAKARFGRRFDESLLVELDLVGFADAKTMIAKGEVDVNDMAFKCKQNPFAEGCDDGVPVGK